MVMAPVVAAGLASLVPTFAFAEETITPAPAPAPAKVELGPPPAESDYGVKGQDFYEDCARVVGHMRYAVQMEKSIPNIAAIAQRTKDEMGDFVSYYRRYNGIQGKQSYSLLYTSINVLSGHYTSYGVKFPVPEKRRKRLLQEFNDIEKNIRKKR
jgi:photosystem II Psb27 protein